MTQEIFRSFKFVHNCQVRGCPKKMSAIRDSYLVRSREGGSFVDGPLALRLFQNDYITSFKFKKLNIFCSNFEYYFEWLATKTTGNESGGAEKSCSSIYFCVKNKIADISV